MQTMTIGADVRLEPARTHEWIPAPTVAWKDPKSWLWVIALMVPILIFAGIGAWKQTGSEAFFWYTPLYVFVIVPILDVVTGKDMSNPPESSAPVLQKIRIYRWFTYVYVPLQYAGLVLACYEWQHTHISPLGKLGLAISVGTVGGIGINTAHEMGHKREELERWLSKVTLAQTAYGHFYVEHNRGHHVKVSTPEDAASSRLGESFWAFLPRSVVGSARDAWALERTRLGKSGKRTISWRNENLTAWAMTVVLFAALCAAFGVGVLPLLLIQAVFGFSLLEVVNYLEHYGLARQKTAKGRYEKVEPRHSWNSTSLISNIALFQLQRHSDHHANPTRRYQALRTFEDAPQLPWGYATMIPLAWMTPVWRRLMDHRVVEHYNGDLSLANIDPRKRERILACDGGPLSY
jgi:alkane 1-monooxygenase